ncbi:hypothetical protein U2F26_06665 [Micromonospora sp. 4G57]|uniref:Nuclear transport factor 2 family protein n=1 Tax=Micromonospora sicca TaxID=2202420 RepID=A0ABU5JGU6_9ACTN|nr:MULTISPECIES: hypothetical protein [unclassified Micromonospora]MDZ5442414.1 hypothetical protein [Micromonospora sp. 4G57]MDZ5491796.1 hypothetical protein [Micromonospora sp. 4G53]
MGDDERERNVEVVRRYLRTFVTKDLAEPAELVAEDVQIYGSGTAVQGRHYVEGAVSSPGLTVLDQRIVQFWGEQDTYGLLGGLGLLPDEPIAF